MKNSIWKKGLTLALAAMVLTTSVSLPADAAEAAPVAETQEAQPGGEAAPAEESTPAAQTGEAASAAETAPVAEAAPQTETTAPEAAVQASDGTVVQAGTMTDNTASGDDNSNNTVNEKPNTGVTITPSNANALVLMDVGAQSPKGVPRELHPPKYHHQTEYFRQRRSIQFQLRIRYRKRHQPEYGNHFLAI